MFIIIILKIIVKISGKIKSVKSSKVRVAKLRAKLSKESKKIARANHSQLMRNQRSKLTDAEKQEAREFDRERKANKRSSMTKEEREKMREKDRLRKAMKYAALTEDEKQKQREKIKSRRAAKKEAMPCKIMKPRKPYSYCKELDRNMLYQEKR